MSAERGWIADPPPPPPRDYIPGEEHKWYVARWGHLKYTDRTTNSDHLVATEPDERTDALQIAERYRRTMSGPAKSQQDRRAESQSGER